MGPLIGFAFGAVVGAVGVALRGTQVAQLARPGAKAVLKTAIFALREARMRQAELVEQAEDLFAEATAEAASEKASRASEAASAAAKKSAEARREDAIRRAEIVAAVGALYSEPGAEPTSERLASAIAAAETRAREIIEGDRAPTQETNATAQTIDLSSIKRAPGARGRS
jgi:hypothetical protein